MGCGKIDIDIFWAIAAEEGLLTRVEEFLTNADEPGLQSRLGALREDVGFALADILADAEPENFTASDDLGNLKGYFELDEDAFAQHSSVTPERLNLFTEVQYALEAHGSEHYQEFSGFVSNLQSFAVPARTTAAPVPSLRA